MDSYSEVSNLDLIVKNNAYNENSRLDLITVFNDVFGEGIDVNINNPRRRGQTPLHQAIRP